MYRAQLIYMYLIQNLTGGVPKTRGQVNVKIVIPSYFHSKFSLKHMANIYNAESCIVLNILPAVVYFLRLGVVTYWNITVKRAS